MGTIVMKMLQNNTKKLKLCFDAITLLLLIFLLAISRMIFFLTITLTDFEHFLKKS